MRVLHLIIHILLIWRWNKLLLLANWKLLTHWVLLLWVLLLWVLLLHVAYLLSYWWVLLRILLLPLWRCKLLLRELSLLLLRKLLSLLLRKLLRELLSLLNLGVLLRRKLLCLHWWVLHLILHSYLLVLLSFELLCFLIWYKIKFN